VRARIEELRNASGRSLPESDLQTFRGVLPRELFHL